MKCLLVFTLLLLTSFTYAQIVNFPDSNFKDSLLNHDPTIDTNNDGEIQFSEAEATIYMNVFASNINDLTGIEAFNNLETLICANNEISVIDPSSLPLLKVLSCSNNNLENIDVNQNLNLEYFFCGNNDISEINIPNNHNLLRISFDDTLIQELDLENNNNLELIRISNTEINTIDVSNLVSLKTLELDYTNITEVDLTSNIILEYFSAYSTNLTEVNIQNNSQLIFLIIGSTNVSSLDISSNAEIRFLDFSNTTIQELDVSMLEDLQWIDFSGTISASIDLSNNDHLCRVDGGNSETLEYINLRNGNNTFFQPDNTCHVQSAHVGYIIPGSVYLYQSNNLEYICVDSIPFAEEYFLEIPAGVQLIEDCSLSISENHTNNLILYPNPSTDAFTVVSEFNISSITIMNTLGQTLLNVKTNSTKEQIDISEFSSGNYLVRITDGNNSSVYQIIKK